jgi:hypothetical protein
LKVPGLGVTKDSPILVVTSPIHALRTSLCFKKAGFTNFRVVTSYVAQGTAGARADPRVVRDTRRSAIGSFAPNGKRYEDPLNRMRWGFSTLLVSVRELAAISFYKLKGWA